MSPDRPSAPDEALPAKLARLAEPAPREIELKLECDGPDLAALGRHPLLHSEAGSTEFLATTYLDTRARALQAAGLSLRLRRSGEHTVQTLKAAAPATAGLFDRPEWEWEVPGPQPDLARLDGTPAGKVLSGARPEDLQPLFRTVIERSRRPVAYGASRIVATLDAGRVETGQGDVPFYEAELELADGLPADLFALAQALGADVPLRLGVLTKAERGHALSEGRLRAPSKAEALDLGPEPSAGEAFARIAQGCLRHLRLNEAVFLHGQDPEALHQMRVALRRLRSAFTLFGPMLGQDRDARRLRAEIRRVAEPFGTARNLDVFLDETLAAEIGRRPDEPGLRDLRERLAAERGRAHAAVLDTIAGQPWRDLLIGLAAWIETGPWRGAEAPGAGQRDRPARALAAEVLDKHHRRVRKRGRRLSGLDAEARHRVRIEAKKLRYGAEFFASLYPRRKAARRRKALAGALSDLQDGLGALNDIATARAIADRLGAARDAGGPDAPTGAALFATGLTAADAESRSGDLLAGAEASYAAFRDVKPFWR